MAEKEHKPKEDKEPKDSQGHAGGGMDAHKKKSIIIAGGIMGVLVLAYLWYENKQSSNANAASGSTTAPTGSGIGSYAWNGNGGSGSGGGSPSITNTFDPTNTSSPTSTVSPTFPSVISVAPKAPTHPKKPIGKPAPKGGKTEIKQTVVKPVVHSSGGTVEKSTSKSTGKTVKTPTAAILNPNAKAIKPTKANITKVKTQSKR